MSIINAKYTANDDGNNSGISFERDGAQWWCPISPLNSDYAEIMRQVEAGELTITDADPLEE
jgi:hypothetical protein